MQKTRELDLHVAAWLDDLVAGRLAGPVAADVEAHLLVCDACFAQYVLSVLGAS